MLRSVDVREETNEALVPQVTSLQPALGRRPGQKVLACVSAANRKMRTVCGLEGYVLAREDEGHESPERESCGDSEWLRQAGETAQISKQTVSWGNISPGTKQNTKAEREMEDATCWTES